jgi:hypothetical protein
MKRNAETQHLMHKVRVTIVVVHVGAVKIYVAVVEAPFFWISPGFGPNSGYLCHVFLTSQKTLIP